MTYLLLSIILNALLFVLFKYLDKKGSHLPTIIFFNYIVCIALGILISPNQAFEKYEVGFRWIHLALGSLFFGIFFLMGKSSATNGIGITSAAGKMSLLISTTLLAIFYSIGLNWLYILALAIALFALYLLSDDGHKKLKDMKIWMPILIFFGSGIIETCLAISKKRQLELGLDQSPSIVFIFSGALAVCSIFIFFEYLRRKFEFKNLGFGLLLGFINFLSMHYFLLALGDRPNLNVNNFMIVHNTSVVLLSFILGIALFKERAGWKQVIGIILSIFAISLTLFEHI